MSEELKLCPFCGGMNVDVSYYWIPEESKITDMVVICDDCDSVGPPMPVTDNEIDTAIEQARKVWNKRAEVKE